MVFIFSFFQILACIVVGTIKKKGTIDYENCK